MSDKKVNSVSENATRCILNQMVDKINGILDADDGKEYAEKQKEILDYLKKIESPVISETRADIAISQHSAEKMKRRFWDAGDEISAGNDIVLRNVRENDREGYLETQREYSVFKSWLKEHSYCEMIWREHCGPKALSFSIIVDGAYAGYCGINNTTRPIWEIGIELLPKWTGRGIGYASISAMLREIQKRLGVCEFYVRVDPRNYASQRLFEKLGAAPDSVTSTMLTDEEIAKCEEKNINQIDDALRETARKFGVSPRKLLSHVLKYRLQIE